MLCLSAKESGNNYMDVRRNGQELELMQELMPGGSLSFCRSVDPSVLTGNEHLF